MGLIRLAFRFDDPSETSHQGVEAGILGVLRKHHACATFGVIPYRIVEGQRKALSEARAKPLIEAAHEGIIEIAQHGYVHTRIRPEPAPPSEFTGRPKNEQHTLITEGRTHLERIFGQAIIGFIPPWNSYDTSTLQVLEHNNFRYVSAGWKTPSGYCGPLKQFPLTTHLNNISTSLSEARRFIKANPVIVIVMHHYDFAESESDSPIIDIPRFADLLKELTGLKGVMLCRLRDITDDFGATARSIRHHHLWAGSTRLHHILPRQCILDTSLWRTLLIGLLNR
jgi:peptidoglycan/xylan/chitin deacetylase (PgdA/CDA1 family)